MEEELDNVPGFDPNEHKVLGVFKDSIHVRGIDCILLVSKTEYFRILKIWIQGKQEICEAYSSYCGEMGIAYAKNYEKLTEQVEMEETFSDETKEDGYRVESVMLDVYLVKKFEDICDFEHG